MSLEMMTSVARKVAADCRGLTLKEESSALCQICLRNPERV